MEVGCEKQSLQTLHFYLYRRALHPELFHIYQEQTFDLAQYEAKIWIVGLSHVVTIRRRNGAALTALTSNENEVLSDLGLVERIRFRGERNCQTNWDDGLRCIMASQVEVMSENLYRQCHMELLQHARRRGMFVEMGQWASSDLLPFTYIDYQSRPAELHVDAFHTFPDDCAMLKMQAIFEVRRTSG